MPGKALDYIRRLNAPREIEDSRKLRTAVWASIAISILALALQGVTGMGLALSSIALITAGSYLSWRRRYRQNLALKLVIMVLTVAALASFLRQVMLQPYDPRIPLAELFVWVQVLHSFDLPRAKDLLLALVSSLILLALAGSFALSASFGLIVLLWLGAALPSLYYIQLSRLRDLSSKPERSSMARPSLKRSALALVLLLIMVSAGGIAAGAVIPRINVSYLRSLPFSIRKAFTPSEGYSFANPGYPDLPLRPPSGALDFNPDAYFGFGPFLDLRARGSLVDLPVMKVRSTEPAYWRGLAFQEYNGFAWLAPQEEPERLSAPVQPFEIEYGSGEAHVATRTVIQTYYLDAEQPNVIFAAFRPSVVYYPADHIYRDESGLKSPFMLDEGLVYSVVSSYVSDERMLPLSRMEVKEGALLPYLDLPPLPERLPALAEEIVPEGATPYARALAIEKFLESEYEYSLDLPPLPDGEDAVDYFLFEQRRGYCEHFASAYALLCRLAGVPSRVVTGYSTGDYNPFTGLYEVSLGDAHAWVEIYLEGIGWVTREPTPGFSLPDPDRGPGAFWIFRDLFSWMGRTLSALLPEPLLSAIKSGATAAFSASVSLVNNFLYSVRNAYWLLGLLLLVVLLLPSGRALRRRERAAASPPLDDPSLAMRDFIAGLESLGLRRSPSQTAGELAAKLSSLVPGLDLSSELALFERARYGGRRLTEEESRRLRRGLDEALEQAKSGIVSFPRGRRSGRAASTP